ncbi:hypothetical protein GCM10027020_17920 [Nocardioides salsibiostraticola]
MTHCPAGHETTATDYCDVCGLAITDTPAASDAAPGPTPGTTPEAPADRCPNCAAANPPNALFCEACGYDYTTGSLPRQVDAPRAAASSAGPAEVSAPTANPSPAPADSWVAEIWIDPDWYADQASTDPMPSPGLPIVTHLQHTSVLIGRSSRSRGIDPDIDLSSDNGISRRHAQLTTDGSRWFVEDLGSSNGTYVGSAAGRLPTAAVPQGQRKEVTDDDRIYLGAWTRIVVRRASPGEI